MKKIVVWRGHHGREIVDLIQKVKTSSDCLLILCPPRIENVDEYFSSLPSGEVIFSGELAGKKSFINESRINYPEFPQFGLFSTGTTDSGAKLILYTKKNLESACEGIFSFFKELNIKSVYSYPQPYHIFGLSLGYYAALQFNWNLVFADGNYSNKHHEKWAETAKREGEKLLTLGTPTHFLDALSYLKIHSLVVPASLTSIAGGAKVEVSLWDKMQNELHIKYPSVGYGCSEASPGVTHLTPGIRPTEDGDLGFVLPEGSLHETTKGFVYKGENVCLAIIQNGVVSFPGGEIVLPDTLAQSENGHYYFKKRADLVLNRGGEKFSLEEIEIEIKKSFQINAVATAVRDERLGEELGILFEGDQMNATQIHQRLTEIFKRTFKLDYILGTQRLPVNANAKYDRKKSLEIILKRDH